MSIVTRVLDLARGTDAFQARNWSRARDLLRDALSAGTSDEALEMLAVSSWWLDDGPTARLARERQFRSLRRAGDHMFLRSRVSYPYQFVPSGRPSS